MREISKVYYFFISFYSAIIFCVLINIRYLPWYNIFSRHSHTNSFHNRRSNIDKNLGIKYANNLIDLNKTKSKVAKLKILFIEILIFFIAYIKQQINNKQKCKSWSKTWTRRNYYR